MFAGIARHRIGFCDPPDYGLPAEASLRHARGEALRSTLELTGPSVCVSAASITAGFSVLMLSEIAPNG